MTGMEDRGINTGGQGEAAACVRCAVAYHDPCYLSRYRGECDAPRGVLSKAGLEAAAVRRQRQDSFCCGAGGGRMWLEEDAEQRVNRLRLAELLETGVECIATACPFCKTMLADGVQEDESCTCRVKDIAELLAERL